MTNTTTTTPNQEQESKSVPLQLIHGATCPSCGRDNSEHGNVCTAADCPGVVLYSAAFKMLAALRMLREDMRMLRDGEWVPDEDSCQASMDVADVAIDGILDVSTPSNPPPEVQSAAIKLTTDAAIRAACELSIAQGAHHAEVMYRSEHFDDDDYVGADLEEFAEAVKDPEEFQEFCGGGRHSWKLWVYEWPGEDSPTIAEDPNESVGRKSA